MKLALVVPGTLKRTETPTRRSIKLSATSAPLNLAALASYVRLKRPDVTLKIIDGALGVDVVKELSRFQPDIVGVTACTPQAPNAYALGDLLHRKRVYAVMGGVHASALPEEALLHFDCVVVGEGELALINILDCFRLGKPVTGIVVGTPLKNLDDEPMPAYDLLDVNEYLRNSIVPGLKDPVMLMVTSRGCIWSCVFCHNSNRKSPPRWFSAERVVDELEYLLAHYRIGSFFFSDDEFLINTKRLMEIGRILQERNMQISWGCQARANTMTLERLQYAKRMGCNLVLPGFESMTPRILKYLKCGTTTVESNERALRAAEKVGVPVGGNFIFGTPTETLEEMRVTFDWMLKHDGLKFANFMTLIPFPGTAVYKLCRRKGLLPPVVDYSRFTMTNRIRSTYVIDTALSLREYDRFLIHSQRVAWVLFRIRLGARFRELLRDLHFWYVLVYHPTKTLKMLQCMASHRPITC